LLRAVFIDDNENGASVVSTLLIAIRSVRVRLIEKAKDHVNEERKPPVPWQAKKRTVETSRKSTLGWLTFEMSYRCKEQMRVYWVLFESEKVFNRMERRDRKRENRRFPTINAPLIFFNALSGQPSR
jgi:hypothetical protein